MKLNSADLRWIVLTAVTVTSFSAAILIPKAPPIKVSQLAMNMPDVVGDWVGKNQRIGERELAILAKDTAFERKSFTNEFDSSVPEVSVSIVFSGKDLNNSIHRPEVCLRTQGWEFVSERYTSASGVLNGRDLPLKEIVCRRTRLDKEGKVVKAANGEPLMDWQLLQYTFFGHEEVTPGHYERTLLDIRDRLIKGYDQSWAYATFSTIITAPYADQGVRIGMLREMGVEETQVFLADFMRDLLPVMVQAPE